MVHNLGTARLGGALQLDTLCSSPGSPGVDRLAVCRRLASNLSFVGGLPQEAGSIITPMLAGLAGLCFIAAALALFGVGISVAWWPSLLVLATVASLVLYRLYLSPLALLPLAIDVCLLWGVLVQHWTVAGLRGT